MKNLMTIFYIYKKKNLMIINPYETKNDSTINNWPSNILLQKKKSAINTPKSKQLRPKRFHATKKGTNDYCTRINTGKTSWWKICSRNAQFIENIQTYLYETGVSSRI